MSIEDKVRWNKKYEHQLLVPSHVLDVVKEFSAKVTGTKAVDIACGMGRHSRFLAQNGFEVDALDISDVAIESLKNVANITPIMVDFDEYKLKENAYDLVVCTYFLERKLFPQIQKALKKEGIFIFETFMHHEKNTKVPSNKSFLLNKGELEESFSEGFEILHHKEFMDESICGDISMKCSIVIKKTVS
ncbi:MAG TPA: methyltransferase domain-containing protein [Campylobacterales bacterium]|nr:methyltransferase domain-containing protein [Campylobacterales bacterium]